MSTSTQILNSIPVDPQTGAISVPIYQTATFVQEAPGVNKGYDYSRSNNPTRSALESVLAALENGSTGLAFASGLAAIDAVLKLLQAGDEIIAVDDIYGGAYRLFTHVYEKFGIKIKYVDTTDVLNVANAIGPDTKLIWLESPTNPTLKISDIAAIAKLSKQCGALLCVDNTFASPILQKPLDLGADIVIHSATKYLGGHSDLIAGALIAKDAELGAKLKFLQNAAGNVLGPFDSWLVLRGIETLSLRVFQQSNSALAVAKYLEQHPEVAAVYYPGLSSHPNHLLAKSQLKAFGSIISFRLKNDTKAAATAFLQNTTLFHLAESLGGVKSLSCLPCEMTHKSVPETKRREVGITDGFIRLSVGIEETEDLIADLAAGLKVISQSRIKELALA
ncbi:PLP-dependent transferase [Taibaiella lutea]|uniref:PLP-dependent transferase n=1 Tax=Taibaiella lutea TaxID=2608001 RepID=A0A5M6CLM2_9BACT|nr:PLP-dependent aspartate aminotransferase family protein [Taibaiella lutea]KAA5536118.1 PLP-dependent transferase [Taibaiella lutea]